MKMSDAIRVCKERIPKEIAWTQNEPYGEYNIEDGNKTISKALYCVTPTQGVLNLFKAGGYDLLISHHPFIAGKGIPQLVFHTALDCCEGGLNDMWRDHLGLKNPYKHFDGTLGWHGEIEPIEFDKLIEKVGAFSGKVEGQKFLGIGESNIIRTVVICSGLGGLVNEQAFETNADCYIIGQNIMPAETTGFRALIETGHTASEWIGVNLFKEILNGMQVDLAPADVDVFGEEFFRAARIRSKQPSYL